MLMGPDGVCPNKTPCKLKYPNSKMHSHPHLRDVAAHGTAPSDSPPRAILGAAADVVAAQHLQGGLDSGSLAREKIQTQNSN